MNHPIPTTRRARALLATAGRLGIPQEERRRTLNAAFLVKMIDERVERGGLNADDIPELMARLAAAVRR